MKIVYQGIPGSYSEACAQKNYPGVETIACKTFDECFEKASKDNNVRALIPESNKKTVNIGVEYLIFRYKLIIYDENNTITAENAEFNENNKIFKTIV